MKNWKLNITSLPDKVLNTIIPLPGGAVLGLYLDNTNHPGYPPLSLPKRGTRRATLLFLLSFLFLSSLHAQEREYKLLKSFELKGATLLTSDKLRNGYVVNGKQEVLKINLQGNVAFKYNNNALGTVTSIDANNPLKILVYYADYSTIVTLDNTLSLTGRINLLELGNNQVSAAAIALDNNIWIYDAILFRVRKIDGSGTLLMETEDLNGQLGKNIRANFLLEKDNFLYLNDPDVGILVFDTYGTYVKTIPLTGLKNFQKVQDQLIFFKEGKLFAYHLFTFATEQIVLPETDYLNAAIEKDRLFLLKNDTLSIYSY